MNDIIEWAIKNTDPTDTFVDVGASDGTISVAVAKERKPKFILAIEGLPFWIGKLVRNFRGVETPYGIECTLVLDYEGFADFYNPATSPSQSSVFNRFQKNKESVNTLRLPVTTLTRLIEKYEINTPMVVKSDCEMADPIVFKGAKKFYPIIKAWCMEWYPSKWEEDGKLNPEEIIKEIKASGFELLDLEGNKLSDEQLLSGYKQDIFLKNLEYGYSK